MRRNIVMEECSRIEALVQQTRDQEQVPPPGAHPILQYPDPTQGMLLFLLPFAESSHIQMPPIVISLPLLLFITLRNIKPAGRLVTISCCVHPGSQFPFFPEGVVFSVFGPRTLLFWAAVFLLSRSGATLAAGRVEKHQDWQRGLLDWHH